MNTSQLKSFAIQSRNILKAGVMNRINALGFDNDGNVVVDRPSHVQGGTVFLGRIREDEFFDAWNALEERIRTRGVKAVCEEAAYTWFNRLVAIRIMQKNGFIEPVLQYVNEDVKVPVIVDQARSGRLSINMSQAERNRLEDLLRDPTKINEQFNLLISAFCQTNTVIFNCFGGIEKHIGLLLPDNILAQGGFIDMLNNTPYLTDEDYTKSELIGWLYQFYISEKKDEVFAKKGKYTPDEIPAATQIFTPNWIVKYMIENTVGRIYLDNNPYADEIKEEMKYLVEPAEPTPEDAILKLEDLTEYKMIDAACGSGHILIEGFNLFYRMYMYEGYAPRAAIENILQKNIIGLDLDTRAKQLATFALLMTAAKVDKSFLDCKVMPRVLDFPEPFVYRGGLMKEFLAHYFLGGNQRIIEETEKAFELMKQADSLGSIMKFDISPETRAAIEKSTAEWERHEFVNPYIKAAIPSMKVILALTDKYSIAVMNPPYMGSGRFDASLSQYSERYYREGKADLFAVFMLVGMQLLVARGKMGMINMQAWMFLSSFLDLRFLFLSNYHIESLLHLGPRTFDELSGDIVQNVAFAVCKTRNKTGAYYRLVSGKTCSEKEFLFLNANKENNSLAFRDYNQDSFMHIPGYSMGYWASSSVLASFNKGHSVSEELFCIQGIITGNTEKYIHKWFEVNNLSILLNKSQFNPSQYWVAYTKGGSFRKWFGNNEHVLYWKNGGDYLVRNRSTNADYYLRPCLTWSLIGSGSFSVRYCETGFLWDVSGSIGFPRSQNWKYVLAFMNSKLVNMYLGLINPTVNTNIEDINSLPIIYSSSTDIHKYTDSCLNIAKLDWDAHETSWDFKKNELILLKDRGLGTLQSGWGSTVSSTKTSLDMLLAEFKAKWGTKYNELHSNEEELNRQFIEIYGLQDELTPDVPKEDITILQQGEISIKDDQIVWHDDVIIKQLISYAIGCWLGRYRLDQEGLYIAHYPTEAEICSYQYNDQSFGIDDDAIIPLMRRDNPFEDDNALQRIIDFVRITFGEESLTENLNTIEHALGKTIEDYMVKDFWKDHKKMYQNRPIYWLFSSKKGAFQVLTYMHRMNPYTVEKIRTKYLLPYIDYLKGRIEVDEARGSELSSVERSNLAKMRVALDECNEYHDRLHEVAIQAIDFDLDDGVVVNYAKFGDVVAKIK